MALRRVSKKSIELGLWHSHGLVREFSTFSLPDLPYDYWALEPVIMTEIMKLHHQQHHQSYVTNYNNALVRLEHALTMADSPTIVRLQSAIKFNGGGHINHSIFWKNLSPVKELGGEPPKPSLGSAIDRQYGSLDALIQKVNAEGAALQGSGWVVSFRNFFEQLSELHQILKWLALDKERKQLSVETTADQDPLVTEGSALVPLIGIDVWEHAYYLQYRDVKSNYLKNIWKVINWKYASEIYEKECP